MRNKFIFILIAILLCSHLNVKASDYSDAYEYILFGDIVNYYEDYSNIGYNDLYSEQDIIYISMLLNIECGSVESDTEKSCVAWTVLNRVDAYNQSIYEVITSPNQFDFYEVEVRDDLYNLTKDVLRRWALEKYGILINVGRTLPKEFLFFQGDGEHNYFYCGGYERYSYYLRSPYNN